MKSCDVREATHVKYQGKIFRIASTWGIDQDGHLAKPSQGGFGVVTDTGERVGMMQADAYYREEPQSE